MLGTARVSLLRCSVGAPWLLRKRGVAVDSAFRSTPEVPRECAVGAPSKGPVAAPWCAVAFQTDV